MSELATTLGEAVRQRGLPLIEALHELQAAEGYLRRESLEALGRAALLPREHIHSVVTFYTNFALEARAERTLRVCGGLPCRLRGGAEALAAARALAAEAGEGKVAVEVFPCLGQCDAPPAALCNYEVVRGADRSRLRAALASTPPPDAYESAPLPPPHPFERRVILEGAERPPDLASFVAAGGYGALARAVAENDPAALIAAVKATNLRGLGGAAFPTGLKWDLVRRAAGEPKFVVVNADEGEPGTFKDRVIMERLPHRLLEGAYLAAFAIGAARIYVYVRDEYRPARAALLRAVEEVRAGPPVPGWTFPPVEVVRGAGSYVCGEETALLESIEGKRGEPRLKPPFPSDFGLFGRPTIINNVETLAALVQKFCKTFEGGTPPSYPPGFRAAPQPPPTKCFSLSGAVARPGLYELPLGTPARALVEECGGGVTPGEGGRKRGVKAFFTAGLAGGFLPGTKLDVPLDFEPLAKEGGALGCASIIVVPEGECIVRVVEEATAFFAHESCGKCTPCRVGSAKMTEILAGWRRRDGEDGGPRTDGGAELELLRDLAPVIVDASICGLGQFAPKPYQDAVRYFGEEVEAHALRRECPEGACFR